MVREKGSKWNRYIGMLFGSLVTEATTGAPLASTVGRSVEPSIFSLFSKCCPDATRSSSRVGLSMIEMNKSLEEVNFLRVRVRTSFDNTLVSSVYRYGGRRWRDPDNEQDMAYLTAMWPYFNKTAKGSCSLAFAVAALREVIAADKQFMTKKKSTVRASSGEQQTHSRASRSCSEADTDTEESPRRQNTGADTEGLVAKQFMQDDEEEPPEFSMYLAEAQPSIPLHVQAAVLDASPSQQTAFCDAAGIECDAERVAVWCAELEGLEATLGLARQGVMDLREVACFCKE